METYRKDEISISIKKNRVNTSNLNTKSNV